MRLQVLLAHEEIGQMIGTTRVTRLFSEFKRKKLISVKGPSLFLTAKSPHDRTATAAAQRYAPGEHREMPGNTPAGAGRHSAR